VVTAAEMHTAVAPAAEMAAAMTSAEMSATAVTATSVAAAVTTASASCQGRIRQHGSDNQDCDSNAGLRHGICSGSIALLK
jgi:hypothetical protein